MTKIQHRKFDGKVYVWNDDRSTKATAQKQADKLRRCDLFVRVTSRIVKDKIIYDIWVRPTPANKEWVLKKLIEQLEQKG